jgi:hypothetical protein
VGRSFRAGTEGIPLAHGFSIDMMVELMRASLTTAKAERMVAPRGVRDWSG